jgi:hypothetical protein
MKEAGSLDGIISHLTKKHGGNVHEKGIVRITAKSVYDDALYGLKNVADLASDSSFVSENQPGQWICWDFVKSRIRPTHYTVRATVPKSWILEGSLDGASWTEIDRQTDNQDFNLDTGSFSVANAGEFRFIRLTQAGKTAQHCDTLGLKAVEFFGSLFC